MMRTITKTVAAAAAGAVLMASGCASTGGGPAVDCSKVTAAPWTGAANWRNGDVYNWTLTFRPDGVLVYAYNGSSYDNGRWEQDGRRVTFHMNNHYADYEGAISGGSMGGTNKNVTGNTGTWRVTRRCPANSR
jgi:hypothetical protein